MQAPCINAQNLMTLVENMNLMAELESGQTQLRDQAVDSAREIRRILALMEPEAQDAGVRISPMSGDGWPTIAVDLRAFRQIMTNLISNAVRHAGAGARLHVSTTTTDEFVTLSVADDGAGIDPAELRKVLHPASFAPQNPRPDNNSLGLGLTVAKELTGLLDGRLDIESRRGEGLTAHLHLPASRLIGIVSGQQSPERASG